MTTVLNRIARLKAEHDELARFAQAIVILSGEDVAITEGNKDESLHSLLSPARRKLESELEELAVWRKSGNHPNIEDSSIVDRIDELMSGTAFYSPDRNDIPLQVAKLLAFFRMVTGEYMNYWDILEAIEREIRNKS